MLIQSVSNDTFLFIAVSLVNNDYIITRKVNREQVLVNCKVEENARKSYATIRYECKMECIIR